MAEIYYIKHIIQNIIIVLSTTFRANHRVSIVLSDHTRVSFQLFVVTLIYKINLKFRERSDQNMLIFFSLYEIYVIYFRLSDLKH
jgi:nickel-dependent lactate racemase